MGITTHRFEALDAWRGICACLVALVHFNAYSHAFDWPLIRNGFIFVDFFFVLSGFVIAHSYQARLINGSCSLGKFMWLRLGRLYPLHLFMLFAFVAFECLFFLPPLAALSMDAPFEGARRSVEAIIANTTLTQSLFIDWNGFNGPSWSISTEFYTYLIFGLGFVGLKKPAWAVGIAFAICPLLIAHLLGQGVLLGEPPLTLIRCVYGFAVGVAVHMIFQMRPPKSSTYWEGFLIALVIAALCFMTPYSVLCAPLLFGAVVYVFADEKGLFSRLLKTRPLLYLGALSYSIYLVHVFVQERLHNGFQLLGKAFNVETFTNVAYDDTVIRQLGTQLWHGDLAYVGMIALVVFVSHFTYTWIECPARNWFKEKAGA